MRILCIKQTLQHKLPWEQPHELKQYLGLKYNEPIDIELISKIEQKLKNIIINVYGDETYISPIISNKVINLKLNNGHCTLKHDAFSTNIKNKVSFTEKTILLYNKKVLWVMMAKH